MPNGRTLISFLILALALPAFARAGGPELTPSELVRQLADASFRAREAAQKELIRLGAVAIVDVKRGADGDDLEIRRRCLTILGEIAKSEVDVFLEPFLAGKEDPKTPFPGWDAIKKIAGDDDTSRYLYAQLYKFDRPMLETLESNPKSLAAQFESRLQKITPLPAGVRKKQEAPPALAIEEIAAVLVIATAGNTGIEANASNRLFSVLSQQPVQQAIRWSHATRRLTEKWIELRCDDATYSYQAFHLARAYGCSDLIESKLRPATAKLIDAAIADPTATAQFYRAINQARQLNMMDMVDQKLRPALRKSIEAAALKEPVDLTRLNQLSSCVQSLGGWDEELKPILRPALTELIKKQAQKLNDMSQFYTIVNLARISQNQDLIEEHLRPVFRASLLRLTAQPKELGPLTNAYYQAQNLGMQEEIDSILRPSAENLILALVAKKNDTMRLQQALSAAQTFQLKEALRPVAQELVDDVGRESLDIQRVNTIIQIARFVELPKIDEIVDKQLKPAVRTAIIAAKDQPINAGTLWQTLNLAEQLQLKDGVGLALKAAETKNLPPHVQSQAIFHVAKNGTRDAIPQLEKLLDEKTDIGSTTVNGITIRAQVADVALASVIHLSGQKLEDYNFPWQRAVGGAGNQILQYAPICYGFDNDAARSTAQKKWRERRAAEKN